MEILNITFLRKKYKFIIIYQKSLKCSIITNKGQFNAINIVKYFNAHLI